MGISWRKCSLNCSKTLFSVSLIMQIFASGVCWLPGVVVQYAVGLQKRMITTRTNEGTASSMRFRRHRTVIFIDEILANHDSTSRSSIPADVCQATGSRWPHLQTTNFGRRRGGVATIRHQTTTLQCGRDNVIGTGFVSPLRVHRASSRARSTEDYSHPRRA